MYYYSVAQVPDLDTTTQGPMNSSVEEQIEETPLES
jgi:hypothetical protein